MNLFYKRHLALFCAIFAVVSIGGCFLYANTKSIIIWILAAVTAILTALVVRFKKQRATILKWIICFLFAILALAESYVAIDLPKQKLVPFLEHPIEAEITVLGQNTVSDMFSSFDVQLELDGKVYKAVLNCEYKGDFSVGDILFGNVILSPVETSQENPTYYLSRGTLITVLSAEDSFSVTDRVYSNLKIRLRTLNSALSRVFEYNIGGDASDLVSAVTLGNKDVLNKSILRDFSRSGLSHVLAISGMHLSIIMMALEWLFQRMGLRKSLRCIYIFLICLFYLALIGFPLSAIRAFVMMAFVYLSFLLRSDNDAVTSLFFALFLILAVSPTAVWDVGLWMSFFAVLGLLIANYFISKISERLYEAKWKRIFIRMSVYLFSALLISLFANAFVCFFIWCYFGEFSLIFVLSNLVISPLITVILFIAPFMLLIQPIPLLSSLTPILSAILRAIGNLILDLIFRMSDWQSITISLRYPFAGYIIVPSFALLLLALCLPLRHKIWIPLIPTVAAVLFTGCLFVHNHQDADSLTVDCFSFGESEMLLLTTEDDAVILDISTGGSSHLYEVIRAAKERFATDISAVIITHYHTYHVSALSRTASAYKIRAFYLPMPATLDDYHLMRSLIDVAQKTGSRVVLYDRSKDFSPINELTVNLSPSAWLKRSTHPTFVLSLTAYGDMLTYVAESAHEDPILYELAHTQISKSDYVLFGAHGPITKTNFYYEGNPACHFFISDPNVLSHWIPTADGKTVYGSSKISIRMKEPPTP